MQISLIPINNLTEPLLVDWLELYETAFPANERLLVADLLRMIHVDTSGSTANRLKFFAGVDETGQFCGLVLVEINSPLAALWYLAIHPARRSAGLGSIIYLQLLELARETSCVGLGFEVEIPESAESPDQARRRIDFYRRNGAFLLEGIHYLQYAGSHQPPRAMHLMIHPFKPMRAQEAYQLLKQQFGDALRQVGELHLS